MNIVTCPNCKMRVIPRSDGACPSCQHLLSKKSKSKANPGKFTGTLDDTKRVVEEGILRKQKMTKDQSHIAIGVLPLSVALFLFSLVLDGFYVDEADPRYAFGWELLVVGWGGLFMGIFAWLANPVLLLAYVFILTRRYEYAAVASLASVIFAASFLFQKTMSPVNVGRISNITGYGAGYWLWLGSAIIMVLNSFYLIYVSKREASA